MRLAIRADANSRIGAGHVMRCLALAQAWQGSACFCCLDAPPWLRQRLAREQFDLHELTADSDLDSMRDCAARVDWVLVDGYHFGPEYLQALGGLGARVAFFDDVPLLSHYPVDLVWNPNLGAQAAPYQPARALVGPDYYPLRREFWPFQGRPRSHSEQASRLVISVGGGSDPHHFTEIALQALASLRLEVRVIVGGSNPDLSRLEPFRSERVSLVVNTDNMADQLAWAELALSAAGVTSYELGFLGTPAMLVVLADNQVSSAQAMARLGCAVNLGPVEQLSGQALAELVGALATSRSRREALCDCSRRLIDGYGAQRVAQIMGDLSCAPR